MRADGEGVLVRGDKYLHESCAGVDDLHVEYFAIFLLVMANSAAARSDTGGNHMWALGLLQGAVRVGTMQVTIDVTGELWV